MYDQETDTKPKETSVGDQRKTNTVGNSDGKQYPMYLRVGYGARLYVGTMGKGSGQRRDFQDDFTRFFYSYRRHDWIPEWHQTHAK